MNMTEENYSVTNHPKVVHMGTRHVGRLAVRMAYICTEGEVTNLNVGLVMSWDAEGVREPTRTAEQLSPKAVASLRSLVTSGPDGVFEVLGMVKCYAEPNSNNIHHVWEGECSWREFARDSKVALHIENEVWFDVLDAQVREVASKVQFCKGPMHKRTLAKCNETHAEKLGYKL